MASQPLPWSVSQEDSSVRGSTVPNLPLPRSAAGERRIANDGLPYALADFEAWYPRDWQERWERARRMPTTEVPPKGLALGGVGPALVQQVLDEILPYFPAPSTRQASGKRSQVEVGWTFDHDGFQATSTPGYVEAEDLRSFPSLHQLLSEGMAQLGGRRTSGLEHRINVSCQLYSSGHGLALHCDRDYVYEEDVYGCVLMNTSDSALEFHRYSGRRGRGDLLQHFAVRESPGVCFAQRGPARFEWMHGVPALTGGERLSVTWRWFLPHIQCTGPAKPTLLGHRSG